jgi:biotin synthase
MTHPLIRTLTQKVLGGRSLTPEEGMALTALTKEHTLDLLVAAHSITQAMQSRFFTCAIVNAKSGTCSQDCHFCAQSRYYRTSAPTHSLLVLDDLVARGVSMAQAGALCFSLVTSGLMLTSAEMDTICQCIALLKKKTSLEISASLGLLTPEYAQRLHDAGLTRYHHNVETARSYFPAICSTHSYDQDLETIALAQEFGLKVCCGGILGLGESWEQRVELAGTLADLQVDTVPLNFLVPIPGTPLERQQLLSVHDALTSVALFRFFLPNTNITIAGGREQVLGDYQSWLFLAGANGMMIGNYLTTQGRDLSKDQRMLEQGQWI